MGPYDFVNWLKGFSEALESKEPSAAQWGIVREKLGSVETVIKPLPYGAIISGNQALAQEQYAKRSPSTSP